jgi:hypothetical protein
MRLRILLNVSLLRWLAVNGGRAAEVIDALVKAQRQATHVEGRLLNSLERHVADGAE